jgi:hypothetical protein
MKRSAILGAALLCAGLLWAETKTSKDAKGPAAEAYKAPVVVKEIGLQAKAEGPAVKLSWKRYKRGDFKFYKLVRSTTNANPMFPDDGAIKFSVDPGETTYEDLAQPGTSYYRLCVITQAGDRWVSPVVSVNSQSAAKSGAPSKPPTPEDFEQ